MRGRLEMLFELVYGGVLTVREAALQAKLAEEEFRMEMESYSQKDDGCKRN